MGIIDFIKALRLATGMGLRDAKYTTEAIWRIYRDFLEVEISDEDIFSKMDFSYAGRIEIHKEFPYKGAIRFVSDDNVAGNFTEIWFINWDPGIAPPWDAHLNISNDSNYF